MKETAEQYFARRKKTYNEQGYYPPKNWENANLGKSSTFNRKMNLNVNNRFPLSLNRRTPNPVLAQRFLNNFKKNGILPANYHIGNAVNMIKVHRAYYGRLPSDPIEFTPHHGKALKNRFRNVFGFSKGRKLYNAVVMVHYPSKLNTNKFMQGEGKFFEKRRAYRIKHFNNSVKLLGLKKPTGGLVYFSFVPRTNSPTMYKYSPNLRPYMMRTPSPHPRSRTPSPPRPRPVSPNRSRIVNTAEKLVPIMEQYGKISSPKLYPIRARNIVKLAKRLRSGNTNYDDLWEHVYTNGLSAHNKFRKSMR